MSFSWVSEVVEEHVKELQVDLMNGSVLCRLLNTIKPSLNIKIDMSSEPESFIANMKRFVTLGMGTFSQIYECL